MRLLAHPSPTLSTGPTKSQGWGGPGLLERDAHAPEPPTLHPRDLVGPVKGLLGEMRLERLRDDVRRRNPRSNARGLLDFLGECRHLCLCRRVHARGNTDEYESASACLSSNTLFRHVDS